MQRQIPRPSTAKQKMDGQVKSSRYAIGAEAVRERLVGSSAFKVDLERRIRSVTVDRKFMSATFGGSHIRLYCDIKSAIRRDKGNHGHHFLFPNPSHNPHVPKEPGEPGLLCRALDYIEWDGLVVKLLVRLRECAYLYLGDYRSTRVRSLSKDEFQALSEQVRLRNLYSPFSGAYSILFTVVQENVGKGYQEQEQISEAAGKNHPPSAAAA